jgi:hypothetical protein
MKKIGLLLLGLLVLVSCSEKVRISPDQDRTFVKFYGNTYEDRGNDVKEVPNLGYAIVGTTTVSSESQASTDILFLLTDMEGNLKRSPLTLGGDYNDYGNSLALTPDGGFLVAGTTTLADGTTDIILVRLDNDGNTLWTKTYGDSTNDTGNSIKIAIDGKYLLAGSTNGNACLLIIDDLGNASSAIPYGTTGYSTIINDVESLQDGYRIIGYKANADDSKSSILITKSNGIHLDNATVPFNYDLREKLFRSWLMPDQNVLFCGTRMGSDGLNKALLGKVGYLEPSSVNLFFKKIINTSGDVVGKSIRMMPDGRIALLATRTINDNSDIVIYFCDSEGNLLSDVSIGDNSVQEAGAFEISSDGGFIITGTNLLDKNSMISLFKTNSRGELE